MHGSLFCANSSKFKLLVRDLTGFAFGEGIMVGDVRVIGPVVGRGDSVSQELELLL